MTYFLQDLVTHANHTPKKTAIRFFEGEEISYSKLVEKSQQASLNVRKAHSSHSAAPIVLIFGPLGIETISAFIGGMLAGYIPSFMPLPSSRQDPKIFWENHQALFRHIAEGIIILPEDFIETFNQHCSGCPMQIISLESCISEVANAKISEINLPNENHTAFLQHSSGTTGMKKGVMLSFEQIAQQITSYNARLELTSNSKIISWLPLYHDMGLIACFILPLALGVEITYLDPFKWTAKPHSLFKAITDYKGTHVWMPNFAFQHMCRTIPTKIAAAYDLSSMQAFINCSETCKNSTIQEFSKNFADIGATIDKMTNCYAMAETVFAVSQTPPNEAIINIDIDRDSKSVIAKNVLPTAGSTNIENMASCGKPIAGVEIRIADDAGKELPEAHCGEIYIKSSFMFSGYYKDEEQSQQAFSDGWYKTRDLGFMMQGEVFVSGRTDDLIIINGRNFYAHEIELAISKIDGVIAGRCAAFGHYRTNVASQVLVILVESPFEGNPEEEKLLSHNISKQLFNSFSLAAFDIIALAPKTIIKTTSGKIHRHANRQRYEEGSLKSWS